MKYKNKCRSRISNLKDPKNPLLRQRVLSREITPDMFAQMSAEVTFSHHGNLLNMSLVLYYRITVDSLIGTRIREISVKEYKVYFP